MVCHCVSILCITGHEFVWPVITHQWIQCGCIFWFTFFSLSLTSHFSFSHFNSEFLSFLSQFLPKENQRATIGKGNAYSFHKRKKKKKRLLCSRTKYQLGVLSFFFLTLQTYAVNDTYFNASSFCYFQNNQSIFICLFLCRSLSLSFYRSSFG